MEQMWAASKKLSTLSTNIWHQKGFWFSHLWASFIFIFWEHSSTQAALGEIFTKANIKLECFRICGKSYFKFHLRLQWKRSCCLGWTHKSSNQQMQGMTHDLTKLASLRRGSQHGTPRKLFTQEKRPLQRNPKSGERILLCAHSQGGRHGWRTNLQDLWLGCVPSRIDSQISEKQNLSQNTLTKALVPDHILISQLTPDCGLQENHAAQLGPVPGNLLPTASKFSLLPPALRNSPLTGGGCESQAGAPKSRPRRMPTFFQWQRTFQSAAPAFNVPTTSKIH